jgi:hypothetical protein
MSHSLILIVLMMITLGSCGTRGESQLSKALSAAVKEKKISEEKKQLILKEYDFVREEDRDKAREYVTQVLSAIEMGGDSSHVDVARKRVVVTLKTKVKV